MAILYYCRHCGIKLGKLDKLSVHTESLGFSALTEEERQEMISYDHSGDIHIKSICEDCQESLERNPALHQYDYLIH
ncbi:anti-sigma-F factor Fin family protein [Bacillus aquiflavi]|uniref:Anti-sigma-F factor Fin family protein n=1 Tax=Bacillus aquiflavi TaxID=2672567 RepID=A0A6B3VSJ7_9BACI|nr:anti-sigma-F factor Fin family protein [Bacillus aquiflavi]MBA4535556.1 anti-sigma-F factor Fin family protein [Bacillus aquiflavi]NEY79932.1 anti-sigma-F factor Fin family protein [Bacillus aquiflavi]UAC48232.1 anti-sigma-F factor Fin family protein [Bacillus aquiflavi]